MLVCKYNTPKNTVCDLLMLSVSGSDQSIGGGGGLSFKVNVERGAYLLLKDKAVLKELLTTGSLIRYIRANHSEWINFITNGLDLVHPREDIIFVSGTIKTTEWAVGAFSNYEHEGSFDITFNAGPWASASSGFKVSTSTSVNVQHREGPSPAITHRPNAPQITQGYETEGLDAMPYNQTVFLHYYKLKNRTFLWPKVMKAAAGPDNLPMYDGDEDEGGVAVRAEYDNAEPEVERVPSLSKVSRLKISYLCTDR